jgi:hypothetical protein
MKRRRAVEDNYKPLAPKVSPWQWGLLMITAEMTSSIVT